VKKEPQAERERASGAARKPSVEAASDLQSVMDEQPAKPRARHIGRAGHCGLKGRRERTRRIGGELEVWSERGASTEVQLILRLP
jgi:hypothetical protein